MTKTATVRARVEPKVKEEAEAIFNELGLTMTEAVTLFLKTVSREHGLPFSIKIPNKETKAVFAKTDKGDGIIKAKNAEEIFHKLGI